MQAVLGVLTCLPDQEFSPPDLDLDPAFIIYVRGVSR
jgi:hypothetical protein